MITTIYLDALPLSLLCQRPGKAEGDACRQWLSVCLQAGLHVHVPEVADYEVRRELIRLRKRSSLLRLDRFNSVSGRYVPITTTAMRRAADLWATSRQAGLPTADPKALDADVILAGQALTAGHPIGTVIVATSNIRHLARFLAADLWQNITP